MKILTVEYWTHRPFFGLSKLDHLCVMLVVLVLFVGPLGYLIWKRITADERRIAAARENPVHYRCTDTRDGEVFTFSTPNIERWGFNYFIVVDDSGQRRRADSASTAYIKCREYQP